MKAAVMYEKGGIPQYADFPEPVIQNDDELLVTMKAVALKNLDKSRASGKHYSTEHETSKARLIGSDGVGVLEDGSRIYGIGPRGTIAEKALLQKSLVVPLPEEIDDATAAALPNAVAGSAMALRFKAGMKPGETVLINGATGFTGKIAVQIAKLYGAKKIIVTGRNEQTLQSLLTLGADEIVSVKQSDEAFVAQLKNIHSKSPIDIIIDYLWGHTAELIFSVLRGNGSFTHKTRFVSIGGISGDIIQLSAETLRSVDLQLSGSGLGSWTKDEMLQLFRSILPEMFALAVSNKIKADTISVDMKDIEKLWNMETKDGKRLVVTI